LRYIARLWLNLVEAKRWTSSIAHFDDSGFGRHCPKFNQG
jgi:hypothetical protein